MGDAASAVLVGACAAVAAISFATAYLADLLIPVTYKATPAPAPVPVKEKTLEERVQILEGVAPAPPPSAPPKEVDLVIERAEVPEIKAPSAPPLEPESIALPPLSTNPNAPRLLEPASTQRAVG